MDEVKSYLATAFVSCSLREEDRPFIDMVEGILEQNGIKPCGTVGKYSAAPMNIAEHMRENIPLSDIVVIVATPRYLQHDLHTGSVSYGLAEMVHVETGMAYMAGKPVVLFVQEGTHVGNFLPNITEYITLSGQRSDVENKWNLIIDLLQNTHTLVKKIKESESSKTFGKIAAAGLAIFGGIRLVSELFSEEKPKRKRTVSRRR